MGDSQNQGYHLGGPQNEDYSILGYVLGPTILGNGHVFCDVCVCSAQGLDSYDYTQYNSSG